MLDAEALERLGRKAMALAATHEGISVESLAEVTALEARFRVFAQVLTATGENMVALERAQAPRTYMPRGRQGSVLDGLEGFQSEAADACTPWPRGRVAQARALKERAGRL